MADTNQNQTLTPPAPQAPKTVAVRILVDTRVGDRELECNTVATLESARAKALVKGGVADDDPEAVKACLEMNPPKPAAKPTEK